MIFQGFQNLRLAQPSIQLFGSTAEVITRVLWDKPPSKSCRASLVTYTYFLWRNRTTLREIIGGVHNHDLLQRAVRVRRFQSRTHVSLFPTIYIYIYIYLSNSLSIIYIYNITSYPLGLYCPEQVNHLPSLQWVTLFRPPNKPLLISAVANEVPVKLSVLVVPLEKSLLYQWWSHEKSTSSYSTPRFGCERFEGKGRASSPL